MAHEAILSIMKEWCFYEAFVHLVLLALELLCNSSCNVALFTPTRKFGDPWPALHQYIFFSST